jgi:hypothetical protein
LHFAKLTKKLSDFSLWFNTGLEHIADWQGYDHILFLIALCAVYDSKKELLLIVTSFTIGHSITLALSVLNFLVIPSAIIEFLIPLTILATCFFNLFNLESRKESKPLFKYSMALIFGFIHGMGFSTLLKSMLGSEENIAYPLFAFNLGLEAGQILIIVAILIFTFITGMFFKIKNRDKKLFLTSAVFGVALIMAIERFFELL